MFPLSLHNCVSFPFHFLLENQFREFVESELSASNKVYRRGSLRITAERKDGYRGAVPLPEHKSELKKTRYWGSSIRGFRRRQKSACVPGEGRALSANSA